MVLFLNLLHYSYLIFPVTCFLCCLKIFTSSIKGKTKSGMDKKFTRNVKHSEKASSLWDTGKIGKTCLGQIMDKQMEKTGRIHEVLNIDSK